MKSGTPIVHNGKINVKIGEMIPMTQGKGTCILVSGSLLPQAVELTEKLTGEGLRVALFSVPTIKPLNSKALIKEISGIPSVITIEEHSVIGGLGSAVAEIIAEAGVKTKLLRLGIQDQFTSITGSQEYLLDYNGLSPKKLYQSIKKFLR